MSAEPDTGRAPPPTLQVTDLSRNYDELAALDSVDLALPAGELVALIGPNGAGKTTLLTTAAGLLEPSEGTVRIDGFPAGSLEARSRASYLPDAPVLDDDLSLGEHLEYIGRLHGVDDWLGRGSQLLARLGLAEWTDNLPSQLSRGMRQKVSIALGFIRPFSLMLADEPFDGLDPPSRSTLFELFDEAIGNRATVVVSTHLREVFERADRCLALADGELAYDGPGDGYTFTELR